LIAEQCRLQQFFTPLPSNEEAQRLYETMRDIAKADGFTCQEKERQGNVQGCNSGKLLVVKSSLDATSKFCTFVHEHTHGILHQDEDLGKTVVECEAEATAYVVAQTIRDTQSFLIRLPDSVWE
jgi:predicted hydrocarbon binding protein